LILSLFLDFLVLIAAAVLGYGGLKAGLIRSTFRFAALLGGFLAAIMFFRDVQEWLGSITSSAASGNSAMITSFLIVFLVVSFAILGVGIVLEQFTKAIMLGGIDKLAGLALGLLMACIIAWAACLSISSMPVEEVQSKFGRSVVFKTYQKMPHFFSLDGMEDARDSIFGGKKRPSESKGEGGMVDI